VETGGWREVGEKARTGVMVEVASRVVSVGRSDSTSWPGSWQANPARSKIIRAAAIKNMGRKDVRVISIGAS